MFLLCSNVTDFNANFKTHAMPLPLLVSSSQEWKARPIRWRWTRLPTVVDQSCNHVICLFGVALLAARHLAVWQNTLSTRRGLFRSRNSFCHCHGVSSSLHFSRSLLSYHVLVDFVPLSEEARSRPQIGDRGWHRRRFWISVKMMLIIIPSHVNHRMSACYEELHRLPR